MALLPEGITELLHHDKLPVPLVCFQKLPLREFSCIDELDVFHIHSSCVKCSKPQTHYFLFSVISILQPYSDILLACLSLTVQILELESFQCFIWSHPKNEIWKFIMGFIRGSETSMWNLGSAPRAIAVKYPIIFILMLLCDGMNYWSFPQVVIVGMKRKHILYGIINLWLVLIHVQRGASW